MKTIAALVLALVTASTSLLAAGSQAPAPQKPPAAPPATQKPATPPPTTQAPAAPGQAAAPSPRPRAAAAPARLSLTVFVTDSSGTPIRDAQVRATGPVEREGTTSREGTVKLQTLRAGTYRLRLEAEGFITLDRDVTVKAGEPEVEVSLERAPAPAKAPEPPPSPKTAPTAIFTLPPADPNAVADVVSVVDWLSKNRLERSEPRKESVVARSAGEAAAILQVRDALRDRTHADADEVIYVINGSAIFSSKGRQQNVETGALLLVPRGVTYSIENRGREPLWALSVVSPGQQK